VRRAFDAGDRRETPRWRIELLPISGGEELSDVLARRANSNPDKINIRDVHGGTSRTYGAWK
jgi:hypothetical protein